MTHPTQTTRDTWNPEQYERFKDERTQPFFDLMSLVQPHQAMRVVDLGCGTGALTQLLHQRLQASETTGLDSSDSMLAAAQPRGGQGLRFVRGDIRPFASGSEIAGTFDLIVSNAALQWVDGHQTLLEGLTARLSQTGQLAVQVPANGDHPSHLAAAEVAGEEPFHSVLGGHVRIFPILNPEAYASLLDRLGYKEQHVRLQVYAHHLPSREGVVEWVKGTLLTDYQKRLPPDLFQGFLDRYRARLLPRLEDSRPFFYPFKRILLWARR